MAAPETGSSAQLSEQDARIQAVEGRIRLLRRIADEAQQSENRPKTDSAEQAIAEQETCRASLLRGAAERQLGRRLPRRKHARVRMLDRAEPESGIRAVDVSVGGICFDCVGLDLGTAEKLELEIMLDERTILATGTVVRVTDGEGGARRVALSFDEDTQRLLAESLPEYGD